MRQKTIFNLIILLLTVALLISCEESTGPDNGEDPKPPGYQEEIPWPSLADSPWPMYHHDPQNTGRTEFNGPVSGIISHEFKDRAAVSNVLIGVDSSLFIMDDEGFHSFDSELNYNWSIKGHNPIPIGAPIISSDSTIYFRIRDNFMAVDYDGNLVWQRNIQVTSSEMSLGKNGTIYMTGGNRELIAFDQNNGEKKWTISGYPFGSIGMSFSPNGDFIYIVGVNEENKGLYAINIHSRSIEWSFGTGFFKYANPVVDNEGNIYTISKQNDSETKFFALTPEGEVKWSFELISNNPIADMYYTPAIDNNGNFFLGLDTLYSLDYDGNLRWKRALSQFTPPESTIDSDIICDNMGNIYFIAQSGNDDRLFILGFDNTGNLLFNQPVSSIRGIGGFSPVIGFQNELIISQYLDTITIIKE